MDRAAATVRFRQNLPYCWCGQVGGHEWRVSGVAVVPHLAANACKLVMGLVCVIPLVRLKLPCSLSHFAILSLSIPNTMRYGSG